MKNLKVFFLFCFLVILPFIDSASGASFTWMGDDFGGDGFSWSDPLNWSTNFTDPSTVPGPSDIAVINGNVGKTWPVIQSAFNANNLGISCGYGNPNGVPTVSVNWNAVVNIEFFNVGYVADGKLIVNGGEVNCSVGCMVGTGNEIWGTSVGTIEIYSGTISTPDLSFGLYTNINMYAGGTGIVNIVGGTISADVITHLDTPGSFINIEEGELIINGDARTQVDAWVSGGYLTAYSGNGAVERIYDSSKTIVTAVDNSSCGKPKWWDHFPRIIRTEIIQTALDHHVNICYNGAQQDPGWGLYGQKLTEVPSKTVALHDAGLKSLGYFETFGDTYCFIAELGPWNGSYNTIKCNHWSWHLYGGGEIIWVGLKNFFDNEVFAQPWTRTHTNYGGPMMTYPDGSVATGYFGGDDTDPRNSRIYDASSSKDILGNLSIIYTYATIPHTNGAIYIPATGKWATLMGIRKDSACPLFPDFTYASTRHCADMGMDGTWSDNFAPFDSFGNEPVLYAFGDWTIARFRDYLSNNFSSSELTGMGVTDVNTFDIRDRLKTIATDKWGWDGSTLSHPAWDNSNWQNEDIWQAFIIFKRQAGTEALKQYYDAVHYAARVAGTEDFLVQGNDIPIFSLGWPRGSLDMVSTEISAGWNLCSGSRGFMMPPAGRIAHAYQVAREHAKSRFVNVWFYNDGFVSYTDNPELTRVLYSEMLANHTLPMFFPDDSRFFGTEEINSDFFEFVSQVESEFGARTPVEDIGIYYSSSSILNQVLPGGVKSFEAQPHQFAIWGWATALGQLQFQCKSIVEWKLSSNVLENLEVLIIPESEVFTDSDVSQILQPWVNNGGKLIVTGISGNRHGETGNFKINSGGYSLKPLTSVTNFSSAPSELLQTVGSGKVLYIKDNIGMNYFNASSLATRAALLPNFSSAMNQVLGNDRDLTVLTPGAGVSSSVGLTVFENPCASNFFVDIVNFDLDLATDTMTDTGELKFTIDLPDWLQGILEAKTFSPTSAPPSVSISPVGPERLEVTVSPVNHYASVKISPIIPEPGLIWIIGLLESWIIVRKFKF